MEQLQYREGDAVSGFWAVEPDLQTITAEKFVQAYEDSKTLEGAIFDREGNLYFTSTMGFTIFKVDMKTKETKVFWHEEGVRPAAVKIHKDGRLFVACVTNETFGGVFCIDPDGSNMRWILRGYSVDDLVFDKDGGFYFTDFIGSFRDKLGGVYYVNPEMNKITQFCGGMCQPNGIALSKDGTILWVTEFQAQRLHRFNIATGRASIPYHFTGFAGPDSCSIDNDDNLYVALPDQGRIMVFNHYGSPIAQIVMPGREKGHNLFTTHPMCRPGKKEVYITCKDTAKDANEGSCVFVAGSFAEGNETMYQFT